MQVILRVEYRGLATGDSGAAQSSGLIFSGIFALYNLHPFCDLYTAVLKLSGWSAVRRPFGQMFGPSPHFKHNSHII